MDKIENKVTYIKRMKLKYYGKRKYIKLNNFFRKSEYKNKDT